MLFRWPLGTGIRSKWETMKWTTVSGVCEPVGAAIFGLLLKPVLTAEVIQGMLAAGTYTPHGLSADPRRFPRSWGPVVGSCMTAVV